MTVRRKPGTPLLLGALGAVVLACASSPPPAEQQKQEKWPEATRTDYEHKDDPCKNKDGTSKECSTDKDCCEGYVCGHDPERSKVAHYCIGG